MVNGILPSKTITNLKHLLFLLDASPENCEVLGCESKWKGILSRKEEFYD